MLRASIIALLMLVLVIACKPTGGTSVSTPTQPVRKQWDKPPAMQIDLNKNYFAVLRTSLGDVRIKLLVKEAPRTANNFVFLARQGFYNGVIFHRIIKDFMIQGGDPTGTGRGGPGYQFADELPVKHSYEPGIVAMANAGPNTQGSQFFIVTGPAGKGLDGYPNYTQFGQVMEGMDVVMKIASVEVERASPTEVSKPKVPPVINRAEIIEQ
ncbi:MAG: peptidylprolyl isomerase [Chloroflexi bacterium]|nr:peptidylprolyl isomerase [Chloroflexota bacterium]